MKGKTKRTRIVKFWCCPLCETEHEDEIISGKTTANIFCDCINDLQNKRLAHQESFYKSQNQDYIEIKIEN